MSDAHSVELNLDEELQKVVGAGRFEFDRAMAVTGPMPMAIFNSYVHLIDRSGVPDQLNAWAALERTKKSGRKAYISFLSLIHISEPRD